MQKGILLAMIGIVFFATSCKKELVDTSTNGIVDYTDVNAFNQAIANGVSFAFFHANWCHNCEEQRPAVEATSMNPQVSFAQFIEVDHVHAESIFDAHNVNGFPHMLIFKDGQEVQRMAGKGHTEQQFVDALLMHK